MRTEEILAAIGTGLWSWDSSSGTVAFDAEAARLVGLPAEATVRPGEEVRPRFHPADWNEIDGIVNFAIAEGTLAEARIRIVDEDGEVVRTVRSRSKPVPLDTPGRHTYVLMGILQEVAPPSEATAAQTPSRATGGGHGRRSCWTPDGRWPRRGPRRRCCGSPVRSPCPGSRRTDWPSSGSRANG